MRMRGDSPGEFERAAMARQLREPVRVGIGLYRPG